MKRDNVNYLLVGIVVVAAFVLFLVALTMITGRWAAPRSITRTTAT